MNKGLDACRLCKFTHHADERGALTVTDLQANKDLPFGVERVFWITDVPEHAVRGSHAHQTCWECIVAVSGAFSLHLTALDGTKRVYRLTSPDQGLIVAPMVWCELTAFTPDAVCLCLASGVYDPEGYINSYEDFCALAAQ